VGKGDAVGVTVTAGVAGMQDERIKTIRKRMEVVGVLLFLMNRILTEMVLLIDLISIKKGFPAGDAANGTHL
jgi:hypothetical protein